MGRRLWLCGRFHDARLLGRCDRIDRVFCAQVAGNGAPPAEADAHETLRRRFANGEINEEEFRRRKATLDE